LKPAISNIPKSVSATVAAQQTTLSMNWGRETSPRPCTPRNERNFPRIRSLLHMAPTSQNDLTQQTERKLPMPTVRTSGQSLSKSRRTAKFLNSYDLHVSNIASGKMSYGELRSTTPEARERE